MLTWFSHFTTIASIGRYIEQDYSIYGKQYNYSRFYSEMPDWVVYAISLWGLVGKEVTQSAMASIHLLTPHLHTAVVYSGQLRHPI